MNLATWLTLSRIVLAVPILVALLVWNAYLVAMVLFGAASLLDWVDGFVARRYNMVSQLGAMLDHIADKLLVGSVLVTLVYITDNLLVLLVTLIIIGRDIAMGGLREYWLQSAQPSKSKVNWLGKWKTAIQMFAITLMLGMLAAGWPIWIASLGLVVAGAMTVASLVSYLKLLQINNEVD